MFVNLSERDKRAIVTALMCVAPSGGGSHPYFLYRNLCEKWGVEHDPVLLASYANTVVDEFFEAFEGHVDPRKPPVKLNG